MVNEIKKNLTNIVVVIGLISSIGVGFSKFAKMELRVNQLTEASKSIDIASVELVESNRLAIETNGFTITDNNTDIAVIKEKLKTHGHNNDHVHDNSAIKILQKEIEVLKLEIQELKEASKNPLS